MTTQFAVSCDTSGMIRPMASMRWNFVSSKVISGYRRSSEVANERSSEIDSMPAKPPPTTVTVRSFARSGLPAGSDAARSKLPTMRSRTATASSMVFMPIALSAMPAIGKVRETEPVVTTMWSYANSKGSPSVGVTVAVFVACEMPVTLPAMFAVRFRWRRRATTA